MKRPFRRKAGPEVVLFLRNRRFVNRKRQMDKYACRHWRRRPRSAKLEVE